MPVYTHLFFDLDHTLWDFEKNSVSTLTLLYQEMNLAGKGIPEFEVFNEVYHEINDRLWERFRKGFMSREDLRWKRMWQTLMHFRIPNEKLAREMSERYLEILPGQTCVFPYCHELLQYCVDKGYALHLITNGFEATQKQKLANAGLSRYFDKLITSEQAMSMKPKPEIFHYAMDLTGAAVHESLMIGDALDVDILGAQGVGMDQVFFNPKKLPHTGNPTYEIDHLHQMLTII
jgi:putative hydrolase of the HAD superfamily